MNIDSETRFKLKTYLYYLAVEPFTERFNFPNTRTVSWGIVIVGALFRIDLLLFVGLVGGLCSHLYWEYKSGRYLSWYRNRKFKEQREALKKVREERKNGLQ